MHQIQLSFFFYFLVVLGPIYLMTRLLGPKICAQERERKKLYQEMCHVTAEKLEEKYVTAVTSWSIFYLGSNRRFDFL
jgi:hypothetical protein